MTSGSDSHAEMHRLPFQPLSDDVVDRLLSGRMPAADAPSEYRGVAGLLETVAGSPIPEETASKATVVAAAIAAVEAAAPVHSAAHASLTQTSRRSSMLSKFLTAKAAAAATVAALGLGTAAAAATGALPMQQANHHATAGLTIAASGQSNGTNGTNGNSNDTKGSENTTGAAKNPHAQFGLCTAFEATHPDASTSSSTVPSDKSTTFSAFESEHGGVSGTYSYCQGVITTHNSTVQNKSGSTPDDNNKPDNTSKPDTTPPAGTGGTDTANKASGDTSTTGTGTADTSSSGASSSGSGHAADH